MRIAAALSTRHVRAACTVIAAIGLSASVTACGSSSKDDKASATPPNNFAPASAPAAPAPGGTATPAAAASTAKSGGGAGTQAPGAAGAGAATATGAAAGDKSGYGQTCGANDLTFRASMQTQAGGYILISATAKPGITCTIPAGLPTVTFGSRGIQATNAEQVVGDAVTVTGTTTVYAGVNPKSTNNDGGTRFTSLAVGIGDQDPDPAGLTIPDTEVDRPVVTNWHTKAADAVPGDSLTS
jgi:hypothetical protein